MKWIVGSAIIMTMMLGSSCAFIEQDYKEETLKLEDTLFKAFPTVNRLSIEITGGLEREILLTFGDKQLYNASDEKLESASKKAAAIVNDIIDDEKKLKKGKIMFTENEESLDIDESKVRTFILPEDILGK